ncbi:MAG: hypothetical protein KJO38_04575 [Gammaproteobacteria bacterium]|nr:hypothetical protein [Gammaproteobacteria bacterium]
MISEAGRTSTATVFALVSATLMIAHQVGGKATRDAIFLSQYDITELPKMVIVAALMSLLGVVLISRLLTSFGPHRVIPTAFWVSAGLLLWNWSVYATRPELVAITLYLQMAVFGAVLISGFWSVVNERFDPHTAKQTIAKVAAAATLGGVIGGLLADRVAALLDVRAMLLVLAGLHLACGVSVTAIGRPRGPSSSDHDIEVSSGVQVLLGSRYLRLMGLLMVLVAVLAALVDFAFKSEAARQFTDEDALVGFFGRFYAAIGVATFLVQSALGPRILQRFGIGVTLAVMPAVVLMAGFINALTLRLWTLVLLRGGQIVFSNSFFRSAFELLYTPLPLSKKRSTKSIIDVASDRLGDVAGSGLILLLLAVVPNMRTTVVIFCAGGVAVLALLVISQLYGAYVQQLADNLRDGAITISDDEVLDATTRQTLAESSAASDREIIMSRIDGFRARQDAEDDDDAGHIRYGRAIAELTSGDTERVVACLEAGQVDGRLVPFLLPLLADEKVADQVRTELRWYVPRNIGAVTDALLDPDVPLAARQRIPSVLEVSHNPRVVRGLMDGLDDDDFAVRYSCARALSRMHERDADLTFSDEHVFAACARELSVECGEWNARTIQSETSKPSDEDDLGPLDDPQINYALEHIFTLLSLVLDRDALQLSLRAVFSSDRGLRGTALEYLENVLPDEIRGLLWPHLGQISEGERRGRGRQALIEELRRGTRRNGKSS